MARASRLLASALAWLMLLGTAGVSGAQSAPDLTAQAVGRLASFAPGSILGLVQNEKGDPIAGVVVSALGATTTFVITDQAGRFEFGTLSPGPYLVRAHLAGYLAPRPQMVEVRASIRSNSSIALRRAGTAAPVLAAGVAVGDARPAPATSSTPPTTEPEPAASPADSPGETG